MAKVVDEKVRRRPRQERSKATVDAIVTATAQLLAMEGLGTSTNRIAKRAGVSVGTIYQYFPDKQALFDAVLDQHVSRQFEATAAVFADTATAPLFEVVERAVRQLLEVHQAEADLQRALAHHIATREARDGEVLDFGCRFTPLLRGALEMRREELAPGLDVEAAAFVLLHAVEALSLRIVQQPPEDVAVERLNRATVAMVWGFLSAGRG